jgi:hypothetical protein
MSRAFRKIAFAATVLALSWQTACSSDDGDDGDDDGGGGSSGSSNGGSSGSGGNEQCDPPCSAGDFCSQCFNPSNPDEPTYACIGEGMSC